MLNAKPIISIAKKELLSFFNSSMGYILIAPFLLITFFLYFRSAFLANQASLRPYFDFLPFALLLFAPVIAMRTFAQEQKNKTLELLYAHPVTELEIVLGKFLGSLGFFAVMLATTISMPITTFIFSNPDPGVVIAQYLGALFVGGAFLAIGIAASSLTSSQVSSFLLAAAINFVFILIGFDFVLLSLPQFIAPFITQLAILPHMENIGRGVLDLRDLLYFISLTGAFLMIAVIRLSQRKTTENLAKRSQLNLGLGLIIGIAIVANVLMYSYPIRLDLTFNRLFTLSKGTKQTLNQLPDIVNVTLYVSKNLPGPVQSNVQKVKDVLTDYSRLSQGKVKVTIKYPDTNKEDKDLAVENGIQEIQFNTLGVNAYAVQAGYFGLQISYGDKKETIPFVQDTSDLEYQLTRRIRKMTSTNQSTLAMYTLPQAQPVIDNSIEVLRQNLETQYNLTSISLDQPEATISAQAIMIYGLQEPLSATASAKLKDYLASGGKALLFIENHHIDPSTGSAAPYITGFESILDSYGITLNQDIVYDTALNETISLGGGNGISYLVPYPLWIKAIPADTNFPGLGEVKSVSMAWANSLKLNEIKDVNQFKLLETSPNGGVQSGSYTILPEQFTDETFTGGQAQELVAAAAIKQNSKIVVVGDSDFISDQFMSRDPGNQNFTSAIIDWTAAPDDLASIPRKIGDTPVFTFTKPSQPIIVQYGNLFAPPILVAAFGVWYLRRRRILAKRTYKV
ncbi:ABC transporter permease subunit [Candidatus Beckwithbacteria bacterium]|nr:ABC transporter permease subunit [Candidatus Beckwithbacteria bacterium]